MVVLRDLWHDVEWQARGDVLDKTAREQGWYDIRDGVWDRLLDSTGDVWAQTREETSLWTL